MQKRITLNEYEAPTLKEVLEYAILSSLENFPKKDHEETIDIVNSIRTGTYKYVHIVSALFTTDVKDYVFYKSLYLYNELVGAQE